MTDTKKTGIEKTEESKTDVTINKNVGQKNISPRSRQKKVSQKVTNTIVIDATGCTLGRVAAYAAKQALNGNKVIIFNSEKAVISGKSQEIFYDYKRKYDAKSQANPWRYGPKRPKNPDRFMRRTVRGMLPWGRARGRAAFKLVMAYIGKPEQEIMKKEHIDLSKAKLFDNTIFKKSYDYSITVGELCAYLGGRKE